LPHERARRAFRHATRVGVNFGSRLFLDFITFIIITIINGDCMRTSLKRQPSPENDRVSRHGAKIRETKNRCLVAVSTKFCIRLLLLLLLLLQRVSPLLSLVLFLPLHKRRGNKAALLSDLSKVYTVSGWPNGKCRTSPCSLTNQRQLQRYPTALLTIRIINSM
jgi:hypothetical protein